MKTTEEMKQMRNSTYNEEWTEVTFECYNSARQIASALRYMHKQSMFGIGLKRCRMENKNRVFAVFECKDDIEMIFEELYDVYRITCAVRVIE